MENANKMENANLTEEEIAEMEEKKHFTEVYKISKLIRLNNLF